VPPLPGTTPPAGRPERRAAGELIDLVLEHMEQNLEPLKYSVLAPSRYLVYLHAGEYARLEGILSIIEQQTIRALNEKLAALNRGSSLNRYTPRFFKRPLPPVENPADWHVEFIADPDGDLAPGAVLITSELLLPVSPELGVGSRTKRIATVYAGARPETRQNEARPADDRPSDPPPADPRPIEARPSDPRPASARPSDAAASSVRAGETRTPDVRTTELRTTDVQTAELPAATPAPAPSPVPPPLPVVPQRALARLSYEDDAGAHEYAVIKASVSIGRGGQTYPVDIRIVSSPDVSREHARIRHDAETGRFCLIDLSTLGTTIDGQAVPRGYDEVDGSKRENGVEMPLPARARIGLANAVFLDFRIER
jgi:hypothetical protein